MAKFTCKVGDTIKLRMQVTTASDRRVPLDLTGSNVTFRGVDRSEAPTVDVNKAVGSGVVVTSAIRGEVEITLTPEDTALFGPGGGVLLYYVRLLSGIDVYTLTSGRITIQRLVSP